VIGSCSNPTASPSISRRSARRAGRLCLVLDDGVRVPKFAEIHSTGSRQDLQKFVTEVIHLMIWPSLLAAGVLAVSARSCSRCSAGFGPGYPVMLVVLAAWCCAPRPGRSKYC